MYNVRIVDLHKIIANEKDSLDYLSNKINVSCPKCHFKKHYVLTKDLDMVNARQTIIR